MSDKKNFNVLVEREYSRGVKHLIQKRYRGARNQTQLFRVLVEDALKVCDLSMYESLFESPQINQVKISDVGIFTGNPSNPIKVFR